LERKLAAILAAETAGHSRQMRAIRTDLFVAGRFLRSGNERCTVRDAAEFSSKW